MPLLRGGTQEEPQDDGTLDQLRTVEKGEPGRGAGTEERGVPRRAPG